MLLQTMTAPRPTELLFVVESVTEVMVADESSEDGRAVWAIAAVGILSVLATSTRTVGFSSVVGAESVKGQNAEGTVSHASSETSVYTASNP